jgi:DNA helicase-2/ATP-dependent DNA helicase PcrA
MRLVTLLPGVGDGSARKYWKALGGSFDGTNAMDRMNLASMMCAKGKPGWEKIAEAFSLAPGHLGAGEDRLVVDDFCRLFYADHLHLAFDGDEADSRLEDIGEITAQIADLKGGVRQFLDEVALMTNLDAKAREGLPEDHVTLTTVHQAKGMEWPVVILPWLSDSIFPSARALEEGNIDEERRLFYVAVTRAKDCLYMCAPKSKKTADGGLFPVDMSIFLREIPKELLEEQTLYSSDRGWGGDSGYGGDDGSGGYGGSGGSRGGYGGKPSKPKYKTTWRR